MLVSDDHAADQRAQHARRDVPDQPGGDRRGDQAAGEQAEHPGRVRCPGSRARTGSRGSPRAPTRNSEVSIEPMTLRGSIRPLARIAGVPTGPQPPPPVASTKPATRPERAEEALAHRLAEVPAVDAAEGEADEEVERRARAGSATSPGPRPRWRGWTGTSRRRRRRPRRGRRSCATTFQSTLPNRQCERPGRQGRADLREVHGRRRRGRVGADGQQQGGRRDAVGHAQAAVDQLRAQADEGEQDEGLHGTELRGSGTAGARGQAQRSGRTRGAPVRRGGSAARTATGADAQQVDVDPPHEEHRRRRHGGYVYQFDRHMQRAVPPSGITSSGRRCGWSPTTRRRPARTAPRRSSSPSGSRW